MTISDETSEQVLLTARQVKRRYGDISDMALWRWVNEPDSYAVPFPKPVYIGRRRYWRSDELDRWEADLAEQGRATRVGHKWIGPAAA